MRRNMEATLVPQITAAAYFSIANIIIRRVCWLAKRSGPSDLPSARSDLTPEIYFHPVKGSQPLKTEESAAEGGGVSN